MSEPLTLIAVQAALLAGEILRRGYGTQYEITYKPGAHNLVTQYDHAAESAIIGLIREKYPDHAFLAEESGASTQDTAPVLWMIDPLDGTTNFAHYIPFFAVSIAAVVDNVVQVGVIYNPMTHELFVASKGQGAFLNGTKLRVSAVNDFYRAFGSTGFPHDIGHETSFYVDRLCKIAQSGKPLRDFGSAAINLAYVAAGKFDFFWIDSLQPWDIAAGKLLVEEAGGKITHYDGSPLRLESDVSVLASNNTLHDTLLSIF